MLGGYHQGTSRVSKARGGLFLRGAHLQLVIQSDVLRRFEQIVNAVIVVNQPQLGPLEFLSKYSCAWLELIGET